MRTSRLTRSQVTCSTKALWLNNVGLIISLTPQLPVVIWGGIGDYADARIGWITLIEEGRETRRFRLGGLGSDEAVWSVMRAGIISHVSWSQHKRGLRVLANKFLPVCVCILWGGGVGGGGNQPRDCVILLRHVGRLHFFLNRAWRYLLDMPVHVVIGYYRWPTFQNASGRQATLFNYRPSAILMYVCVCFCHKCAFVAYTVVHVCPLRT